MKKKTGKTTENAIVCPKCGTKIDIPALLKSQADKDVETEVAKKISEIRKEIEEENKNDVKRIQDKMKKKMEEEIEFREREMREELEEKKKKIKVFAEKEAELRKQKRELEEQKEQAKLELERKLDEEMRKIRTDLAKKIHDEHVQKEQQLQKQLMDVTTQLEEARRKADQGSMQTQGEVFQKNLEEILKATFADDEIKPIPKGVAGADVHQYVRDETDVNCGLIVWESKQTKAWSGKWTQKLKADVQEARGDVGVIVSSVLPEGIAHFGIHDGVWISDMESAMQLGYILRGSILELSKVKKSFKGKDERVEALYDYLTGPHFRQKVESIISAFSGMRKDLDAEKTVYTKLWAKREKQLERVMSSTSGMYGDLQGLLGGDKMQELPALDIKSIGGPDEMKEEEEKA